jgi:hypothetical protein
VHQRIGNSQMLSLETQWSRLRVLARGRCSWSPRNRGIEEHQCPRNWGEVGMAKRYPGSDIPGCAQPQAHRVQKSRKAWHLFRKLPA